MSHAHALIAKLREQGANYRRQSKAYRTGSVQQAELSKGAAVFDMAARQLESAIDADAEVVPVSQSVRSRGRRNAKAPDPAPARGNAEHVGNAAAGIDGAWETLAEGSVRTEAAGRADAAEPEPADQGA